MDVTPLRKLINEVIPPGGVEEDTHFTDAELESLLNDKQNLYLAASLAWTIKAGLYQGQIESYKVGNESYDVTKLKDQVEHALKMSERYAEMARAAGVSGGVIISVRPPEVL
jgi:hypothetical protein